MKFKDILVYLKNITKSKTIQGIGMLFVAGCLPHIDQALGTDFVNLSIAGLPLQTALTTTGALYAGFGRLKAKGEIKLKNDN